MEGTVGTGNRRSYMHSPILVVCFTVLLFFTSQLVTALLLAPVITSIASQNVQILFYISLNLAVAAALTLTAKSVLKFEWRAVGVVVPKVKTVILVLPAFLLYFAVSALLTMFATQLISGFNASQTQDVGFENFSSTLELVAGFIGLAILTPIFEEFIFRGVLFKGLRRSMKFWTAAILASLLFGLAHLQWNVAIDTFALGMFLCYLTEKSGSIVPSILLHVLKNMLAFTLLFVLKV